MDHFTQKAHFWERDGLAKNRGLKNLCKKKVCLVSTDRAFLETTLYNMSQSNDCFDVRLSTDAREGAHIGYCRFTNDSSVGDIWARFESHPKVWVTIHDDVFCEEYQSKIRTY